MGEITVVMTAYNGEAYIEEQIMSVLEGSFQDFDIHVYDDGSTDRTREILGKLEQAYPDRIKFFANPENKGVIRNFTEGARAAQSSYVMFCDQDDVWLSDKLLKSLERIKKEEKQYGEETPVVVFTDAVVTDEKLSVLAASFHKSSHLNPQKTDLPHLLMENKLIGCTMIINAAMQDKLSIVPKEARMHDWWVGLVGAALGRVAYLPEPTLLYRQHEKNVVGSSSFQGYVKTRLSSLGGQRQVLRRTQEQGAAFLRVYQKELSQEKKEILQDFEELLSAGFIRKRCLLIKNGFWKTGLLRNIGLFLLL